MRIEIAQRYTPFSHVPGTLTLIPGSSITAKIYPGRLQIFKGEQSLFDERVDVKGPIDDFSILCDLEKWRTTVSGKAKDGFFRYSLTAQDNKLYLVQEKGDKSIFPTLEIPLKNRYPLLDNVESYPKPNIRLALGKNKKLDWDRVKSRRSLEEIIPVWFQAGIVYPLENETKVEFDFSSFTSQEKKAKLLHLFLAGFSGIFSPRIEDEEYQNIFLDNHLPFDDPFTLLSEGAFSIFSLFCHLTQEKIILQEPIFHSGRMTSIESDAARIHFRWAGYRHKMITIQGKKNAEVVLQLPPSVRSFRLRKNRNEKGVRLPNGNSIAIEKNLWYCIDRLQY